MQRLPARLLLSAVCLVLGFLIVAQFRSTHDDRTAIPAAPADQAAYIGQLYSSNLSQRASLDQLQAEIARYQQAQDGGSSDLVSLIKDLQQLRMLNGEVDVAGPGVQVRVDGAQNEVQVLQDLVNELRNAGAEAIGVNHIRLVTRSVIAPDPAGHLAVDGRPLAGPYLLEAIGDPPTLQTALERKGGVIALLEQAQGSRLTIKVTRRSDAAGIGLPRTALAPAWHYAHPVAGN